MASNIRDTIVIVIKGGIGDYLSFTTYYKAIRDQYPDHNMHIIQFQYDSFPELGDILRDLVQDLDPKGVVFTYVDRKDAPNRNLNVTVEEVVRLNVQLDQVENIFTFVNGRPNCNLKRGDVILRYSEKPGYIETNKKNIVIHRYSGTPYKRRIDWGMSDDFWIQVEDRLISNGWNVIIIGGREDPHKKSNSQVKYLQGRITVREAASIIRYADAYFGQTTWSTIVASNWCKKIMSYYPDNSNVFGAGSPQNNNVCFQINISNIYFLSKSAVNVALVCRYFEAYNEFDLVVPDAIASLLVQRDNKINPVRSEIEKIKNDSKKIVEITNNSKSTITNKIVTGSNIKTSVFVCKSFGGAGDYIFLNYLWPHIIDKKDNNFLVVRDNLTSLYNNVGFNRIIPMSHTSIGRHGYDDYEDISSIRSLFSNNINLYDLFNGLNDIESNEINKVGRIHRDRLQIIADNIGRGLISGTYKNSYMIQSEEQRETNKIFNTLFLNKNRNNRKMTIGIAPKGANKEDFMYFYKDLIERLKTLNYNIVILHSNSDYNLPYVTRIPDFDNIRKVIAFLKCLDLVISVDTMWIHAAAIADIPTIIITGRGLGSVISRYHRLSELIYPNTFHKEYCPCTRRKTEDNCFITVNNKKVLKCLAVDLNKVISTVKIMAANKLYPLSSRIAITGSSIEELEHAISLVLLRYQNRSISVIITSPDSNKRDKIKSEIDKKYKKYDIKVNFLPTIDGSSLSTKLLEYLASNRHHLYFDASYIDKEIT